MYVIAANDDYVYACSNLNGSSYVSRCPRSGGEVAEVGYALDHTAVRGDTLYTQSDRTLRTYDLTRGWEVQASVEISHIDGRFSYISGMVSAEG